jgi:hypothetical protein
LAFGRRDVREKIGKKKIQRLQAVTHVAAAEAALFGLFGIPSAVTHPSADTWFAASREGFTMTNVSRIGFISVAAASLALAGSIAPAQAAQAASRAGATVQGQNQAASSERRICVRSEMPNTRISRRICRTQAEWDLAGGVPTNG